MGEIAFMAVLALVGIVMFAMTADFPTSVIDKSGGPAMFPRLVICLLLAVMVVRTIKILRNKSLLKQRFVCADLFKGSSLTYLCLFVGYAAFITTLGFVATSSLFLVVAIPYLYRRQDGKWPAPGRILAIAVLSVAGVVALNYLFTSVLDVILPTGLWGS